MILNIEFPKVYLQIIVLYFRHIMNACIKRLYLHIYITKNTIPKTNIFLLTKHYFWGGLL